MKGEHIMKPILKLTIFIMAVGLLWATGAFAQVGPRQPAAGRVR